MPGFYNDDNAPTAETFDERYDDQQPEEEEPEEEPGENTPIVYLDGDVVTAADNRPVYYDAPIDRVQVAFPAAENGEQSDADERAPLGWCNSAAIQLDRADDAVHVSISVGDPRGAFVFTVRRLRNGQLLMHFPTPEDGALHMPLTLISHGVYRIGHSAD